MKRFLQSFGLPYDGRTLLAGVLMFFAFVALAALTNWIVAVVVIAIALGIFNGFFTQRKN